MLILAFFKTKISTFFEGREVQNLIKHQEEKIIFQQNVFYFVKLFESSLKIYFGPLGTSWGLRNHFGSQKELKKVQRYTYRAFFGGGYWKPSIGANAIWYTVSTYNFGFYAFVESLETH